MKEIGLLFLIGSGLFICIFGIPILVMYFADEVTKILGKLGDDNK